MQIDILLSKLQYKGQKPIVLLNQPGYFKFLLEELQKVSPVVTDVDEIEQFNCGIFFVKTKVEIDLISRFIAQKAVKGALIWMCYPKKSSKGYQSSLSRDVGWEAMGRIGFEPVRQISMNDDWSALRFRKLEEIKNMTRSPNMRLTSPRRR